MIPSGQCSPLKMWLSKEAFWGDILLWTSHSSLNTVESYSPCCSLYFCRLQYVTGFNGHFIICYLAYQGGWGTGLLVTGMPCNLLIIPRALGRLRGSSSMHASIRSATSWGHSSGTLQQASTHPLIMRDSLSRNLHFMPCEADTTSKAAR